MGPGRIRDAFGYIEGCDPYSVQLSSGSMKLIVTLGEGLEII